MLIAALPKQAAYFTISEIVPAPTCVHLRDGERNPFHRHRRDHSIQAQVVPRHHISVPR